jgi:hypothetical protein
VTPELVTIDYQAPGAGTRLNFADSVRGVGHVALQPPAHLVSDVAAYVDAMLGERSYQGKRVTLVAYCLAYALRAAVAAGLERRGAQVTRIVGLDPQEASETRLRLCYAAVVDQLPSATVSGEVEAVLAADPEQVAARLPAALSALVAPLRPAIAKEIGLPDDGAGDELVTELVARYRIWLQHGLACHAAAAGSTGDHEVTVLMSADYDLARARLRDRPVALWRCESSILTSSRLPEILEGLVDGGSVPGAGRASAEVG